MSKTNRTDPNPRKAVKRNPRSIRIELDAKEYEAIAERAKANFSRPTPYSKGVLLKHLEGGIDVQKGGVYISDGTFIPNEHLEASI
jgi:hypothetical protein